MMEMGESSASLSERGVIMNPPRTTVGEARGTLAALRALEKEALLRVCEGVAAEVGMEVFARQLGQKRVQEEATATASRSGEEEEEEEEGRVGKKKKKKRRKEGRPFEMSRWAQRDVAMWISYEGEKYSGLAEQRENASVSTVEGRVFEALETCRLIESRASCRYSRCGRTDRGVSALRQVLGLRLRSSLRRSETEDGVAPALAHPGDEVAPGRTELKYCEMLNRVLPPDIRAVAWRDVPADFSARFSAKSRTYRYFFVDRSPKTGRGYDLAAMRDAARRLVGTHDFRHFCKMDVEHVANYQRQLYAVSVDRFFSDDDGVFFIELTGQAFLWHMVRCIAAVLFLVGAGLEDPAVVDAMLDVDVVARRPQYPPADELPLVLHDCAYDTLQPAPTPDVLARLDHHLQSRLDQALLLAARRRNALLSLRALPVRTSDLKTYLDDKTDALVLTKIPVGRSGSVLWGDALPAVQAAAEAKLRSQYAPLLQRQGGMTYDERIHNMGSRKRERLDANDRKRLASKGRDQAFHAAMRRLG